MIERKEAAYLLGVSEMWITRRVGREDTPFYKRGRKIVIPRAEFDEYRKQRIVK